MSISASPHSCLKLKTGGEEQIVLILVGLIGSGKSTFAQALQQHHPQFRRCNQDELGDRSQVENLARCSLREGLSVCIDRTNFNAVQRSYWINIAREFLGTVVWVIVFQTPYEVCAARLRERTFHPTIKSPEQGLAVLGRFANDFQYPSPLEGYDRLIELWPSDNLSPIYRPADITSILQRLRDSAPMSIPISTSSCTKGSSSFRGNGGARGNARQVNYLPRTRHALSYSINTQGRGMYNSQSATRGSFDRIRSTTGRSNIYQRATENSRGGASDSLNWRGSRS